MMKTFSFPAENVGVPKTVTRRQIKLALHSLGLLDSIDTMIASSGDRELQINWAEAVDYERNHPLILQMAVALGKTTEEIDALFISAKAL